MDALITLIRLPIGLVAMLVVLVFYIGFFVIEAIMAAIAFPLAALFMDRDRFRETWIGHFPNSVHGARAMFFRIRRWIRHD